MTSIEIAARFAAYTWFCTQPKNSGRSAEEAHRYADRNHYHYLDVALANRGVGRLLARLISARDFSRRAVSISRNDMRSNSNELCGSN